MHAAYLKKKGIKFRPRASSNGKNAAFSTEELAAETTTLFQAVSNAEYADAMATRIFRSDGGASYETGKFFAESGENALHWGNAMEGLRQLPRPSGRVSKFGGRSISSIPKP